MIASGQDLTRYNEGLTLTAKPDAKGAWCIGWGHDIPPSPGLVWTPGQCDAQFWLDYEQAGRYAANDFGQQEWTMLGDQRRAVLTDIAYETGDSGLRKFKQLLAAVRATNWDDAAQALRHSLLFQQVPNRENRNIAILLTGAWPQV